MLRFDVETINIQNRYSLCRVPLSYDDDDDDDDDDVMSLSVYNFKLKNILYIIVFSVIRYCMSLW